MLSPVKIYKGEQVPLFGGISLEISSKCNRTCVFCPNHDFVRPDTQMPMELIKKAIDELAELKYHGRFQPYMYNEPLRDPRLFKILRRVRRKLPRAVINVSTNCDYLTEDLLDQLVEVGTNQLILNIYSSRDGNKDEEKVQKGVKIAERRAALIQSWLDARPHISQEGSLYNSGSPKKIVARVLHKYGVQKDSTNFGGSYTLANRSGNVAWLMPKKGKLKAKGGVCTRPFRMMEIRWTGDVILCCHDYNGTKPLGNIADQSLVEIWNTMELHRIREELQQGIRKGPLCGVCDYNGGSYKHMIHPVQLQRAEKRA